MSAHSLHFSETINGKFISAFAKPKQNCVSRNIILQNRVHTQIFLSAKTPECVIHLRVWTFCKPQCLCYHLFLLKCLHLSSLMQWFFCIPHHRAKIAVPSRSWYILLKITSDQGDSYFGHMPQTQNVIISTNFCHFCSFHYLMYSLF